MLRKPLIALLLGGLLAAVVVVPQEAPGAPEDDVYIVRSPEPLPQIGDLRIVDRRGPARLVTASPATVDELRRRGCSVVPYDPDVALPKLPLRTWRPILEADPLIQGLVDQVAWDDLEARIRMLEDLDTRYSFSPQCAAAADSLHAFFTALGLDTGFHEFMLAGSTLRNVVATQTGTVHPDSIFVICGHYDSTSDDPWNRAPGADDNASGTAAVMTAAAILSGHDFAYTIKYVAFSGEEQGLTGSQAWVAWADQQGLAIVGALNADMVGWWTDGVDFDLEIESNEASVWLATAITNAADLYTTMPYELHVFDGAWWGDHASFWQYGYAAVNHEESWDWGDPDFNPWYHSTHDLLSLLSPEFTEGNTRILVAALATLAQLQTATTAVAEAPPVVAVAVSAHPNPFNGRVNLQLVAASETDVAQVTVHDLAGRRLDAFEVPLRDGRGVVSWEARDGDGRALPAGVYHFRCRTAHGEAGVRAVYVP